MCNFQAAQPRSPSQRLTAFLLFSNTYTVPYNACLTKQAHGEFFHFIKGTDMKTKLGITLSVLLAFSTPVLADPFVVKINNQFSFIDETGKLVIPAKYDDARDFSDGLASVKINDENVIINKSGKVIFNITKEEKQQAK